ncbi:FAST kinase domain-containing protein 2, mitochondrial [Varanus komodoensis]|uniref:FAST kinase domains 2 n=1 Tax=Varanus komodoensis TaxID=61221 RepID=A0A8D2LYA4_VARKO|nr:FAST kinase domain-containing protein 2, mitochondrial isoform X2 [Varanus komodoensis]KAF7243590.1 FAST kinase domain-containing protein 2, mitochondrial [Varanus komodoensis]
MNRKLDFLIRTVRKLQACHYAWGSSSRTAVPVLAFGISRPVNAVKSIYPCQFLWYVSSPGHQSFVRFFSEDILPCNVEEANADKQKATKELLEEHAQGPEPVLIKPTQLPSDFSVSPNEDQSAVKEEVEMSPDQLFFNDLRKCLSPCDVLDLIKKHPFSLKHSSNCIVSMWILTKKLSEDQRFYERKLMFQHPQFSLLCQRLMNEAKYMWPDDVAQSMLAVVRLGVPQNTLLVQTLLRVCQERLNEFNDRSLSVVASTLQVMEKCKNVEALQAGLLLLVEQRLPKISDIFILQTILKSVGKDASLSLKTKLEKKLLNQMDRFTHTNTHFMFNVLAEINFRSSSILNACSDRFIEHIHGTSFSQLLEVLRSCRKLVYRNVKLYAAIANYVAAFFMWDTKQILQFISAFENLGFQPIDLMDKFAEKVISHPGSLSMKEIISVLRFYSFLNHIPKGQHQEFLEVLNDVLTNHLPSISNVNLLRAIYSFCILGYLPQPAVNQLLQQEIINDLLTSGEQNIEQNKMMLHTVNVCLQLDGHSLIAPTTLPVDKPPSGSALIHPDVEEVLLTLLGDRSLFQSNVQETHGYNIDFEILMDVNRGIVISNAEAELLPDDSKIQRVAVLCARPSALCVESKHPRGKLAMKMRHLRLLGYRVILVHYQEFQKLNKDEAIDFFKGEIFSADASSDFK